MQFASATTVHQVVTWAPLSNQLPKKNGELCEQTIGTRFTELHKQIKTNPVRAAELATTIHSVTSLERMTYCNYKISRHGCAHRILFTCFFRFVVSFPSHPLPLMNCLLVLQRCLRQQHYAPRRCSYL
jgi:hypothetical protein